MRRREFITLVGGAAVLGPLAAQAQAQPKLPVIGLLSATTMESSQDMIASFRKSLAEQGYVEGRNVSIEHRFANGRYENLAGFVADLVRRRVDIIFATGGNAPVHAAKTATRTIPIVFTMGSDPVREGIVNSLSRPGENITGATFNVRPLAGKRMALLRELVPQLKTVAVLVNPSNPAASDDLNIITAAAHELGLQVRSFSARTAEEIDAAFTSLARSAVEALFVNADAFLHSQRQRIAALASRQSIPAIYPRREYVLQGGLISYSTDVLETYRVAGSYVGRILRGEQPGDLPVQLPTKFELAINIKAAKALGLSVPQVLLVVADEVIE